MERVTVFVYPLGSKSDLLFPSTFHLLARTKIARSAAEAVVVVAAEAALTVVAAAARAVAAGAPTGPLATLVVPRGLPTPEVEGAPAPLPT